MEKFFQLHEKKLELIQMFGVAARCDDKGADDDIKIDTLYDIVQHISVSSVADNGRQTILREGVFN